MSVNSSLKKAGVSDKYVYFGSTLTPLEAIVNGFVSGKPYVDILLEHLPLEDNHTKEFIVRALTWNGNRKAALPLINLFYLDPPMLESELWAVGNALSVIGDASHLQQLLKICSDRSLASSRQMLFSLIARSKSEEVYQTLIVSLNDNEVKGHVLEALREFGDKRALPIIENITVEKGKYEERAKKSAIKKLSAQRKGA
jgi:hypothetical protein